jgi:hypothetical protein
MVFFNEIDGVTWILAYPPLLNKEFMHQPSGYHALSSYYIKLLLFCQLLYLLEGQVFRPDSILEIEISDTRAP